MPLAAWYALSLREDRIPFWQSGISALQRGSHADAAAHSGCVRSSHSAPHGAHESVCAGVDGLRRAAARARAPTRRDTTARHSADSCCCGFFCLLLVNALSVQRAGRRAADALSAADVSAGACWLQCPQFIAACPTGTALRAVSAAAFFVGLFINPPYGFAPEDNLAYARVVRMHQAGIAELHKRYPGATVLTAWPMSDELTKPELGYVKQPWDVVRDRRLFAAADRPRRAGSRRLFGSAGVLDQIRSRDAAVQAGRRGARRTLLRAAS